MTVVQLTLLCPPQRGLQVVGGTPVLQARKQLLRMMLGRSPFSVEPMGPD